MLAVVLTAAPLAAEAQLYICTLRSGRTLTGDAPPHDCQDVPIRELNADGSIRRVIEPPLTPEERKKREQEEKERHERERQAQEQHRRDRALLETYASEDEIEASRDRTLAERQGLIDKGKHHLEEVEVDRKRLDDEAEFYAKRQLPEKLKREIEANDQLKRQQLHQMDDIRQDMQRINERYDAQLRRFRELVNSGATPVQRQSSSDSAPH